ncbi:unnamed protein product [Oikopleura dioica]|uniref:Major facilitator superfamily (MFS) profile domain-containing protein n=1 Tax=Oikopleura dioica TaxID=34765 RepID=E4Y130_OIKDI|nr:unnamed protein product [Oikopleura dioica]
MLTSVFGFYFPDWRDFTFAIALSHFITLVVTPFFPESPSFLYARNRSKEGREILQKFSDRTNKSLDSKFLDELEAEINEKNLSGDKKEEVKNLTILDLFSHRLLAKNAMIVAFGFFSAVLSYYGMSFNVSSLSGDLYLNNSINGFMEIISYIVVMTLMEYCGRRWCSGGLMFFGGIFSILCATFQLIGLVNGARWLSFAGKFAVSGALCSIYIFAGELFPTEIRSTGIGFGSMVGRLGGFMSPFIIQIQNKVLVYAIFGLFGVLGGGFLFLLPEVKV